MSTSAEPEQQQKEQSDSQRARYAELIIYAVIFISLVASVFVINLNIANDSQRDTEQIFCATKQQEYWQASISNIRDVQQSVVTGVPYDSFFKEFGTSTKQFDETVQALYSGGKFMVNSVEYGVTPVKDERARKMVNSTKEMWAVHRADVIRLIDSFNPQTKALDTLLLDRSVDYAITHEADILRNNRDFITQLGQSSTERTSRLQTIQIVALLAGLIVFAAMAVRLSVSLRQQDKVIQDSQSQLIQAEKMASLGQMVAGLAHEMNTPLGFIRNNIQIIEENEKEFHHAMEKCGVILGKIEREDYSGLEIVVPEALDAMKSIESVGLVDENKMMLENSIQGVDRIQELVSNLKNFSRLDEANLQKSSINESLDSTLVIANHILKRHMTIRKQYGTVPDIMCYPAQLNQVFLNIMTNASQACEDNPEGGVLLIKTSLDGDDVVVQISDNGKGIAPANLKKIFDPFFTTKPIGQGTGLGLSIVFKIIESHKGKIDVKSEVGKGTDFFIRIPAVKKLTKETTERVFQDDTVLS
ncbi:MAG: GHKL domain-containing protein [Rhizobacter sp.]|nr:GHKL domain-containing protein [Chlorobiales bacterium]